MFWVWPDSFSKSFVFIRGSALLWSYALRLVSHAHLMSSGARSRVIDIRLPVVEQQSTTHGKFCFLTLNFLVKSFITVNKNSRRIMILLRCWRRNFILLIVVVCKCWDGVIARQKARGHGQNEPSAKSIPRVAATNETNAVQSSADETGLELEKPHQTAGILNLGCQGIRIRRYVSNGRCTSRRPFRDLICDGQCMPMDELPWFPEYSKVISRRKREWRCVPDEVKTKKVTVVCIDGNKFKYRVRVVRSCKCKRYTHKQNQTNPWRVLFKTKQNLQCGATVKRHSRTDIPSLYCFVM